MCPGPQGVFCLWHFWSSLTPQQHFQDFSWNWETDTKFAAICAKQLFLNVTLDAWYTSQGKQPRATSQGCAVSVGPSLWWPKFVEAPSVLTTKSATFLYFLVDPPASRLFLHLWHCNMRLALQSVHHIPQGTIFFQVLHYLAHSREQYYKLNWNHTESCLQCKAQEFSLFKCHWWNPHK